MEVRRIVDWQVIDSWQFRVSQVVVFGGDARRYQVLVAPEN